jgi:hypothetical protein
MRYWFAQISLILALGAAMAAAAPASEASGPIYVDPDTAAQESRAFNLQGEFAGQNHNDQTQGLQVIARGRHEFEARLYEGGLPGAGYDGSGTVIKLTGSLEDDKLVLRGEGIRITVKDQQAIVIPDDEARYTLTRQKRTSPTLGKQPPDKAIVLFDGTEQSLSNWRDGKISEAGFLKEGTQTRDEFDAFSLHIEFRLPFKPNASDMERGNSGMYIQNRYELQMLDSFGLPPQIDGCGALFDMKPPRLNMTFPPLSWQTYDVVFEGPTFNDAGEKIDKARMTVRHNGVVIHDDVALPHGTGSWVGKGEVESGPILLQDHHNPVRYRNIWLVPHK